MEITTTLHLLLLDKFTIEIFEIAKAIFERMEDYKEYDTDEALVNAIEDELIYSSDMWAIMEYYQDPLDANFNEAKKLFFDDLFNILQKINN